MTRKQEIAALKAEMAANLARLEVLRFNIMWSKLLQLAGRARDVELLEDMGWFLRKFKHYTEFHAGQKSRAKSAAGHKAKISDAEYDRLAPNAKSKKELAGKFNVHPVSLSRYEKKRFGKKS